MPVALEVGASCGVVEEGVAGGGIFLDVVGYLCLVECRVEPVGRAPKRRVAAAVLATMGQASASVSPRWRGSWP